MQVRGLPSHVIRNAGAAARLLAAKTPHIEAERRRDAVARWRRALAQGLSGEQAADAVGVARANLYRWENNAEPRSRRPHRRRARQWPSQLVRAIEHLRGDNPMWGKSKIAILLKREGLTASVSKVGRILAHLVARGAVVPVPILRRNPAARRIHRTAKERYARRLPKGRKAKTPGELVQIDTLFVNVRPDIAVKHFTAYDPVAKWTIGKVARSASAQAAKSLLEKLIAEAPFAVRGIQVDGGSEFKALFELECQTRGLELFVLPPKRPRPQRLRRTRPVELAIRILRTLMTSPTASTSSRTMSTPSPTASIITDHTRPLPAKPQPSISKPAAKVPPASHMC